MASRRLNHTDHRDRRIGVLVPGGIGWGRHIQLGVGIYRRRRTHWTMLAEPVADADAMLDVALATCDGLLVDASPDVLAALRASDIPAVVLTDIPDAPRPIVCADSYTAGQIAGRYFADRGYRHFAYVGWPGLVWSEVRKTGFIDAIGPGVDFHEFHPTYQDTESTDHWLRHLADLTDWLADLPTPVALFVNNDAHARHVTEAARHAGLAIPDQLSLLGVDNDETVCETTTPRLSTVDTNATRVGFEAAALLDRILSHDIAPADIPSRTLVPPKGIKHRETTGRHAITDPLLADATRYIRDHITEPIDVPDIAAAVGVARRTLEYHFENELGITPFDQLRTLRLDRARALLVDTPMTITEIATASGYREPRHFSTAFKKATGETPSAYRKARL